MTLIFMLSFFEGVSPKIVEMEGIWRSFFSHLFNLEGNDTDVQRELNGLLDVTKLFMAEQGPTLSFCFSVIFPSAILYK